MPQKSSRRRKLSRQEQRDLDVEIGFLEGVVRRDPRYVDALQVLAGDYTQRGRYAEGLAMDEQLSRLMPDNPAVLYNLACSYSLTDRVEEAAAILSQAIDRGYRDFRWLERDPDLRSLRSHPVFNAIKAKIKSVKVKVE
jgi:tetratricopeptide (TPR) repeat protein